MSYTPTNKDYEWASRFGRSFACKLRVDGLKDDAAQEACIAVWQGSRSYDPSRGVPFRNYVAKRIVGGIKDLIRSEIGRDGESMPLRNALAIAEANVQDPDRRYVVLNDGSKPVLRRLIECEEVRLLHEACFEDHEHWQLDSWAGLVTQRVIARRRGVSESYVSLCASRFRAELQATFEIGTPA